MLQTGLGPLLSDSPASLFFTIFRGLRDTRLLLWPLFFRA
jgi:hypothetical protein